MFKNRKFLNGIKVTAMMLIMLTIVSAAGKADPASAAEQVSEESQEIGTWCYVGACSHPVYKLQKIVESNGQTYFVSDTGSTKKYTGTYVEPGWTFARSFSTGFETSITSETSVGSDLYGFDETIGVSSTYVLEKEITFSKTNDEGRRMYVHICAEYEKRTAHGFNQYKRVRPNKFGDYCTYEYDHWIQGTEAIVGSGLTVNWFPEKYNETYSDLITY